MKPANETKTDISYSQIHTVYVINKGLPNRPTGSGQLLGKPANHLTGTGQETGKAGNLSEESVDVKYNICYQRILQLTKNMLPGWHQVKDERLCDAPNHLTGPVRESQKSGRDHEHPHLTQQGWLRGAPKYTVWPAQWTRKAGHPMRKTARDHIIRCI